MRIAVDFDDTVADQSSILIMLMNWKLGTNMAREDVTWNWFHKDAETEKAFWGVYDMYDTSYLRRAMAPVDPFVFAVLKELQRKGHTVEIVTRNKAESAEHIRGWLFMHGIDIRLRLMGRGGGDVSQKAKLTYDVFIDDSPLLANVMHRHPSKRLILYSVPWNKEIKTTKNIYRADNWLEVREILRSLGA